MELSDVVVRKNAVLEDADIQPLMAKVRPSATCTASSAAAGDSLRESSAEQQSPSQPETEYGTLVAQDGEQAAEAEQSWYKDQSVLVALLTSGFGAFLFSSFDEVQPRCLLPYTIAAACVA